jgi:DNA repair exonuclease SbcCD ATPase subunit
VNQLEEQITSLKRELASMQDQSTAAAERIKQLQEEQQTRATAMTGLDQKMASHQAALESLNNRVDAKRVDFEIQKNKTQEIAPGLFLTVQRADAGKQQIDGKLQVSADSRMMPIRAQGTQIPVVFYATGENRPMQLVFTKVEKNSVSGYVMVPNQQTVASK